jgi:hypothetical protein
MTEENMTEKIIGTALVVSQLPGPEVRGSGVVVIPGTGEVAAAVPTVLGHGTAGKDRGERILAQEEHEKRKSKRAWWE